MARRFLRSSNHSSSPPCALATSWIQGHGVGLAEFVEGVGELGVFGRAVGVDDRPEGGRLPRRRLRVEV